MFADNNAAKAAVAAQGDEEEVVVDERNYVQGGSRYCIYGAYQITVLRHAGP